MQTNKQCDAWLSCCLSLSLSLSPALSLSVFACRSALTRTDTIMCHYIKSFANTPSVGQRRQLPGQLVAARLANFISVFSFCGLLLLSCLSVGHKTKTPLGNSNSPGTHMSASLCTVCVCACVRVGFEEPPQSRQLIC